MQTDTHQKATTEPQQAHTRHHEKMQAKRTRRELEAAINWINALENDGVDFRVALNRPDLPDALCTKTVSFVFAEAEDYFGGRKGAQMADAWAGASLTVLGLFALCAWRDESGRKDDRGIAMMTTKQNHGPRQKGNVASWTGIGLDDDNHSALGRQVLGRKDGPLRCCFGTASDGKHEGHFSAAQYRNWQQQVGAEPLGKAADGDIEQFLNHSKQGNPHRGVTLARTTGGYPNLIKINGEHHARFTMVPQERSRTIVVFDEPIEGDLLKEIISRGLEKLVCEEIEKDIFGVVAHDTMTKTVNAVAYLPSGRLAKHYFEVCGKPYLYDAVAAARRVLAANPRREKPKQSAFSPTSGVSGGLRGLLLATLIEERFPELMRGTKTSPLVLHCCPFADGHSTRRGQKDGSAFVFDGDTEGHDYAHIGCKHESCSGYSTKDFVNEMIRNGDLPADIYQDQDYRIELE